MSPFYDAMLAKVVAQGATRAEASARLAGALASAKLHGVRNNRDLLVGVLRSPAWLSGDVDTSFLDRHDPKVLGAPLADADAVRLHCAAATLGAAAGRRAHASVLAGLPSGWRNLPSTLQTTAWTVGDREVAVGYAHRRDGTVVEVDGTPLADVRVWSATGERVDLDVDGVRRTYELSSAGGTTFVDSSLGATALVEVERYPEPGSGLAEGALVAPMPGTVVRVEVSQGDAVTAGQVLVVLEAMKMEHAVRSAIDGTVTDVGVVGGQQVDAGALLVVVETA